MVATRQHQSALPRALGFTVILHLLAVLWMAASPALHGAAHSDASEPEHSCGVTMFAAGNFHAPTTAAVFAAHVELTLIARMVPLTERVVGNHFSIGVLEHAPPATV